MTQVMNARELADELRAEAFKLSRSIFGDQRALGRLLDRASEALRATPDREAVLEEAARAVEALNGLIWASAAAATIRALKSSPTDPVARAVEGEREACAKVADDAKAICEALPFEVDGPLMERFAEIVQFARTGVAEAIAAAIRARKPEGSE